MGLFAELQTLLMLYTEVLHIASSDFMSML